ncbi:PAS domain-containing protein [Kordiimonas lipolytica]|uniref:PAS domain-containing protein n=1 Tax=Kordiimonas lipolytica TaxID=1662421 RepID=A0ABV8UBV2_9PROT|nr:PAS domain-containing protein [Kordiimonas lipolytica]
MLGEKDFQNFVAYWQSLADSAGDIPLRSAIQLKDIPKVAPCFYLLQWQGPEVMTVRLLGTALDAFIPDLGVGSDFLGVYHGEQKDFYTKAMAPICSHPCGMSITRQTTLSNGHKVDIRGVGLPARDENGAVTFQLGLTDTPDRDTPLGYSIDLQRNHSRIVEFDYFDIGYGVPNEKPAIPYDNEMAGSSTGMV